MRTRCSLERGWVCQERETTSATSINIAKLPFSRVQRSARELPISRLEEVQPHAVTRGKWDELFVSLHARVGKDAQSSGEFDVR